VDLGGEVPGRALELVHDAVTHLVSSPGAPVSLAIRDADESILTLRALQRRITRASPGAPASVGEAVAAYRSARDRWETRLGSYVSRNAENTVIPALADGVS